MVENNKAVCEHWTGYKRYVSNMNAVRQAEENPEGFKRSCLEAEQSSDIDIKQIRSYPVYKGETEEIALERKLKEEAESNE